MIKKFFEYNSINLDIEDIKEYFIDALDDGFKLTDWELPSRQNLYFPSKFNNLIYARLSIHHNIKLNIQKELSKSKNIILTMLPTSQDISRINYNSFHNMENLSRIEN